MNVHHALVIAVALVSLAPPAYAAESPVTADECVSGGGVVYTDANGYTACSGGMFDARYVV